MFLILTRNHHLRRIFELNLLNFHLVLLHPSFVESQLNQLLRWVEYQQFLWHQVNKLQKPLFQRNNFIWIRLEQLCAILGQTLPHRPRGKLCCICWISLWFYHFVRETRKQPYNHSWFQNERHQIFSKLTRVLELLKHFSYFLNTGTLWHATRKLLDFFHKNRRNN